MIVLNTRNVLYVVIIIINNPILLIVYTTIVRSFTSRIAEYANSALWPAHIAMEFIMIDAPAAQSS